MPSGEEKGTDQGPERVLYVCSQPFVLPVDFPHPGGDKVRPRGPHGSCMRCMPDLQRQPRASEGVGT